MRDDGYFEKWASAVLGVVCLFLVWHLARRFNDSRAAVPQQRLARSRSRRPPMFVSHRPHRLDKIREVAPVTKPTPPRSAHAEHTSKPRSARAAAKMPAPARTQVAAVHPDPAPAPPPAPAVAEFKPLGYVERPDGSVEGVVAEGSRVFLVREGETFADRYRVLKVSASVVRAVDTLAAQPAPTVVPQETLMATRQDAPRPPVAPSLAQGTPKPSRLEDRGLAGSFPVPIPKALASPIKAALGAVPNSGAKTAEAKMSGASTRNSGERLGYVEMAGGTLKNIVAEGGEIKLIPQEYVVAQRLKAANEPLFSAAMRPDTFGNAPPIHPKAEGPVIALGTTREAIANKQLPPAVAGVLAAGTGPPGGLTEVKSGEAIGPSGVGPPRSPPPWPTEGQSKKPKTTVAGTRVPAKRAESVFPAPITLKSVCYVEKADGSVEAVVASGSGAYLVHEGDIFADRYRVEKNSPSTVEVEDEMASSGMPPPSGRKELAVGSADWSHPLMASYHLPPERPSKPWVAMGMGEVLADSGNGLETVGAGLSPAEVLALQKPTSAISESSTSKREAIAGPNPEGPAAQSPSNEPQFAAVINKAGGNGGADVPRGNPADKGELLRTSGEEKLFAITPLPLEIRTQVLQLPALLETPVQAVRPVGESVLTLRTAQAGRAPVSLAGGNQNLSAEGFASISGASGTEAAFASAVSGSGYDLLLQFAIGDNTCYPPR